MSARPNILLIMADQLAALALPSYGHPIVKTPHLDRLAAGGVVFESCYCNNPLCAPSRASMLTGQLASRIGVFDNAAELPASIPTFAHYLRARNYQTCTAGKMHLVGPDQLHGFEERLTTDIYPADFGWTPDWKQQPDRRFSWYHNMLSVVQAGLCQTSNQLDFDEEVAFIAVRKIFDFARQENGDPFCMMVSFTHPHDPFATTQEYWDRYDHFQIDLPAVDPIPFDDLDPHSQRLYRMCAMEQYRLTEDRVRNARHAYYSMISYVDDKIGLLLRALETTGLSDNTIIIFLSDHGEMLGERGLWYKMNFFEWSARVPLMMYAPARFPAGRVPHLVSLVDLVPTLLELTGEGQASPDTTTDLDGQSLLPLLQGKQSGRTEAVFGEYLAEGAIAPCFMIRRDRYKYIYCPPDPDQLFDLETDPQELNNLAPEPAYEELRRKLHAEVMTRWNPEGLEQQVLKSQRQRRLVHQALMTGQYRAWDFQPYRDASKQYMRSQLDLNILERTARFPPPDVPPPDRLIDPE